MGQNQGKISDKKLKKSKGLKHAKVSKKKNKKKAAKKMGKLSEEVYQEETGEWVEDSGGFVETNKEKLDAKSEEHDNIRTYAIDETQVDVDVTIEKGKEDNVNTYKHVKTSENETELLDKRDSNAKNWSVHQTEKYVDGNEVEKSVVLFDNRTRQIPLSNYEDMYRPREKLNVGRHEEQFEGKHDEMYRPREELNCRRYDEQFDSVKPLSSERNFQMQTYDVVNEQSKLKEKEPYKTTIGHLDKSFSNRNDVTEERNLTSQPDWSFRQDHHPYGHQKQDTMSQRSNEGLSMEVKQGYVPKRRSSPAVTDTLIRPQEVKKYMEQDDRKVEKKDDAEILIAKHDLTMKEIENQEPTERKYRETSEIMSSSSSSGHRYQKIARIKHEKPPRQKYGTTSSKKKEIISFLFLLFLKVFFCLLIGFKL